MKLWRRVFAERRRVLVPLLVLLLVNIAVLALAVWPLRKIVSSNESAAAQSLTDLLLANRRLHDAQAARASRDRAETELKEFYAHVLPASKAQAVHLTYLELDHIATESGLQLQQQAFDSVPVKNSRLEMFKTEVSLTGEYPNIRKFLYEVETAEPFFVIEKVALAPAKEQKTTNTGALQVVVNIATYYLSGGQ